MGRQGAPVCGVPVWRVLGCAHLLGGLLDHRQMKLCPDLEAELLVQGGGWIIGLDVKKWGFAAVQDPGHDFGHEGVPVASATEAGMGANGADLSKAGEAEPFPCHGYPGPGVV